MQRIPSISLLLLLLLPLLTFSQELTSDGGAATIINGLFEGDVHQQQQQQQSGYASAQTDAGGTNHPDPDDGTASITKPSSLPDEDEEAEEEEEKMRDSKRENPTPVPVCCDAGLYLNHSRCVPMPADSPSQLDFPLVYRSAVDLRPSSKTAADFVTFTHNPCRFGSFGIDPVEDVYYFLENGLILAENLTEPALVDQDNYCLVALPIPITPDSNVAKTIVAICLPPEEKGIPTIYSIFHLISSACLAATFFVYSIFPHLHNIHGSIVKAHVSILGTAYLTLAIVQLGDQYVIYHEPLCYFLAYVVHFSFLASFFWLNVMCFDIFWTFGGFRSLHGSVKQRERKKFIMYSIYAWGCASILTGVCMIMDLVPGIPQDIVKPEFGVGSCWFHTNIARAIYFYGPMGVTVMCNICLFIITAVKILQHQKDTARQLKGSDSKRHDDNKQWFNLYLKLFVVMGINWSMEIISWLYPDAFLKYLWYVTDLTNTLQGVIIFLIFVWKDKIKRLLLRRFGFENGKWVSRNSTTRNGCPTSSMATRATCVTTSAPLQDKPNFAPDAGCRGKTNAVCTDTDSDCV